MLIVSLLLISLAYAAGNSAMGKKWERVKQMVSRDNVVILNTESYNQYVASSSRNYSFVVLMTAMGSQYGCKACHEFDSEYRLTAKSFLRSVSEEDASRVFFGILDFKDGSEIFQQMRLTTAPMVYYHPTNANNPVHYDMNTHGIKAEDFSRFLEREAQVSFTISRPVNFQLYGLVFAGVGAAAAMLKFLSPYISGLVGNHRVWATGSLVFIVMMLSGHMWNHIRNPPYVYPDNNNKLRYVAPGFSNQYGLESQIVAGLLALVSIALIVLNHTIPSFGANDKMRILPLIALGVIFFGYSWIISLFRIKNGGYPFKILFL